MSDIRRFFVDDIDYPARPSVTIEGEEFVHAKTVLRAEVGDEIILLDGSGKEYPAIIDGIDRRSLSAHITGERAGEREPKADICLICGALKGDKTELVVQKATELGVNRIIIFSSQYCAAFINQNKLERLKKVAKEAAKQCLRSRAPIVEYCGGFSEALSLASGYKNKLFFCEFAGSSDGDISAISGDCALIVGSEGGFSREEAELAERSGFLKMSLGRRILRAETACIAAITLAAAALGELE